MLAAGTSCQPVLDPSPRPASDRRPGPAVVRGWPEAGVGAPREVSFVPGRTLFFDGDTAVHFFEIVIGTVRCCRLTPDGRRQIYRFAGAGDMLGLGGEAAHTYSAEAVTGVVARRHRLAVLDAAMASDGRLRRRVFGALREELAAIRLQMVLLGQMSAAERVAAFLIALAERVGEPRAPLHLPMTRADIADYLGLSIETVSRKISELKRHGVIELASPTELRITEHARLEAIAKAA